MKLTRRDFIRSTAVSMASVAAGLEVSASNVITESGAALGNT